MEGEGRRGEGDGEEKKGGWGRRGGGWATFLLSPANWARKCGRKFGISRTRLPPIHRCIYSYTVHIDVTCKNLGKRMKDKKFRWRKWTRKGCPNFYSLSKVWKKVRSKKEIDTCGAEVRNFLLRPFDRVVPAIYSCSNQNGQLIDFIFSVWSKHIAPKLKSRSIRCPPIIQNVNNELNLWQIMLFGFKTYSWKYFLENFVAPSL